MSKYKKTLIGFERTDNQPLEKNVVFATSAELTAYLQSDPTKYNGQVVTVKGNGTATKGVSYRIDQLGNTWKAVPLADSEDVATKAQGGKADTAVQAATVGGTSVSKSGTTLQFPAYPTSLPASDKATILSEAATAAQNKVNAHANDTTKHITAAERSKWNTAIQTAKIGTVAVTKSGTELQLPAYPTSLPASDKSTILSEAATAAQSKVDAAIKANVTDKKGAINGLATLDGTGKVPANQLPSYVDDVIELRGFDIPSTASGFTTGDLMYQSSNKKIYSFYGQSVGWGESGDPESGKIYVSLQDNKTYRWSGSDMVVISETIALGETSSTAYPGDKGKKNATDIASLKTGKLDTTGNGSNVTSTFTTASSRANIVSGERLSVMFGKVAKWFGDLKALAFKDKVGTADITDGVVTETKLSSEIKTVLGRAKIFCTEANYRLIISSADTSNSPLTMNADITSRFDSNGITISGIKKYVEITCSIINDTGINMNYMELQIKDEAGNIVTSLFTKQFIERENKIVYTFDAFSNVGTLYISINEIPYNYGDF